MVIIGLAVMKWHEGRLTVFGRGSKAYSRIQARAELKRVAEAQAVEAGAAEGQALEGFEKQYEGSSEEGAAPNTTHLDKNDDSHDVTLTPMTEKSL